MTSYFQHNEPRNWMRKGDVIDAPGDVAVIEATSAEDRAAFSWAWQRAARDQWHEAYAALMLEGAE